MKPSLRFLYLLFVSAPLCLGQEIAANSQEVHNKLVCSDLHCFNTAYDCKDNLCHRALTSAQLRELADELDRLGPANPSSALAAKLRDEADRIDGHPLPWFLSREAGEDIKKIYAKLIDLLEKASDSKKVHLTKNVKWIKYTEGLTDIASGVADAAGRRYVTVDDWDQMLEGVSKVTVSVASDGKLDDIADLGLWIAKQQSQRFFNKLFDDATQKMVLEQWVTLQNRRLADGLPIVGPDQATLREAGVSDLMQGLLEGEIRRINAEIDSGGPKSAWTFDLWEGRDGGVEAVLVKNTPDFASALASGDWKQVRELLATENSTDPIVKWLSAHAALYSGDFAASAQFFAGLGSFPSSSAYRSWAEAFLQARGQTVTGLLLLGDALVRNGDYRQALAAFDQGLAIDPNDVPVHNARASLYGLLGDSNASLAGFHKAFPYFYSLCSGGGTHGGENLPRCPAPKQFPPPPGGPPPPSPAVSDGGGRRCPDGSLPPCRNPAATPNDPPRCADGSRPPCRHKSGGDSDDSDDRPHRGGVSLAYRSESHDDSLFTYMGDDGSPQQTPSHEQGLTAPTLLYSNLQLKK